MNPLIRKHSNEMLEMAALHAIGLLPEGEVRSLESHIEAGCAVCRRELESLREAAALMAHAASQHSPPASLREKVLERVHRKPTRESGVQVWRDWSASRPAPIHVVAAAQGEWEPLDIDGIRVKRLYSDPALDTVALLIRMDPGAEYPGHRHAGPEHCYVIEGELTVGDISLRAGDYQCATEHSTHTVTRTEKGCLILIISSLRDELLA
jgi:anti-sigma factor ChrR (cupin superfamily)